MQKKTMNRWRLKLEDKEILFHEEAHHSKDQGKDEGIVKEPAAAEKCAKSQKWN